MHRFFVPSSWIKDRVVCLTGQPSYQLSKVLRLGPKARIIVLDNSGWEYVVELTEVTTKFVKGNIVNTIRCKGEPKFRITLYQGLLKGHKFDQVLQRGTEIGIFCFVPVSCQRSVTLTKKNSWFESKYPRWRKIISEAAEQSKRGLLPDIAAPIDFSEACKTARGFSIMPWEEEKTVGLKQILDQGLNKKTFATDISLFIGPEGGFSPEEVALAVSKGINIVTLGCRTLRSETAAIVAASAVLYEMGEFG